MSIGALSEPAVPESGWIGVAASRARHGVLAVWSEGHVRLSRDDGRTFEEALAGPGRVESVVLGDDGTLYVARAGRRLGVLRPDGASWWRVVDGFGDPEALVAGAGWLIWFDGDWRDPHMAISRDHGRTCAWRALPDSTGPRTVEPPTGSSTAISTPTLDGASARLVARGAPEHALPVVDAAGRPLVLVAGGRLLRRSGGAWQTLLAPRPPPTGGGENNE
ncbi:MAG: hypothetical protein EXR72_25670 [Myxococcales bacterium]|nr:hypothetical protein [Myxococcales bacterium]